MKVIASFNGLAATRRAFDLLAGGEDLLRAAVEGIALVEDDPSDLTVGYGGLPNADGIVELDAAVMDGRTHRVGAVAALRNIRNPSRVALRVMEATERVLLVGEGALKFALAQGFVEEDLLTPLSRKIWEHWRACGDENWQPPADAGLDPEVASYVARHSQRPQGTVHLAARDANGNMACVTSTSGHAFKPPGRVGDSPIAGAGLYVDSDAGTCGSLGHGESNLQNLSSFAAVELMRRGMPPLDAGLTALRRIVEKTPPSLRDVQGRTRVDVRLYLMAADGRHAGVSIWPGQQMAVTDESGTRMEACTALYQR